MAEKLSETDINRLRGVVGLGTSNSPAEPEPKASNIPQPREEHIVPKPKGLPESKPKNIDNYIRPDKPEKKPTPKIEPAHSVDADLFVKIDEHAEIAKSLIDSKSDIKAIADTISLLSKAENLKAEAIERLEAHLNELDAKLDAVEEKLAMPEGIDTTEDIEISPASDVSNLHKTLENLRDQLDKLE